MVTKGGKGMNNENIADPSGFVLSGDSYSWCCLDQGRVAANQG